MDQMSQERRGLFGGLRVPFDLNMLVLAFAAVVGFYGLVELIESVTREDHVILRIAAQIIPGQELRGVDSPKPIAWILVGIVFLAFWTFFATAVSRIAAMKIAREETIEVKDAAKFAARKFLAVLSSVLFVATIVLVFYVVCNATIAGFLMRIPGVDIVGAVLFVLVLLSTFFIVFSLVLGVFGMNLAASAIATESSDTWDGISRAWNYILVRPWHVLLCYGLTFAYLAVFSVFAGKFLTWSVDSLAIGAYGAGERAKVVSIDKEDIANLPTHLRESVPSGATTARFVLPGKVHYYRGYVFGGYDGERVNYYPTDEDKEVLASLAPEVRADIRNPNGGVNVAELIPGTWRISAAIIWFWVKLATFAIVAYAVQYFFAATTKLYFLLRKEVEDEDFSEIVVEEEEELEEQAWDVKEPTKPGAAPLPGAPGGGAPGGLKPLPLAGGPAAPAPAPASAPAPVPAPVPAPAPAASPSGSATSASPAPPAADKKLPHQRIAGDPLPVEWPSAPS